MLLFTVIVVIVVDLVIYLIVAIFTIVIFTSFHSIFYQFVAFTPLPIPILPLHLHYFAITFTDCVAPFVYDLLLQLPVVGFYTFTARWIAVRLLLLVITCYVTLYIGYGCLVDSFTFTVVTLRYVTLPFATALRYVPLLVIPRYVTRYVTRYIAHCCVIAFYPLPFCVTRYVTLHYRFTFTLPATLIAHYVTLYTGLRYLPLTFYLRLHYLPVVPVTVGYFTLFYTC